MLKTVPVDNSITIEELTRSPYPIYRRLRRDAPVLKVANLGRIFLTKAEDTKKVKEDPETFSSNDPNTPMKRAFLAHTLMRKDGDDHRDERLAMMPAFHPPVIKDHWVPMYERLADEYLDRLPKNETVELFSELAAPIAARFLAEMMGMPDASDDDMARWSQTLIDGAGNFGWRDDLFAQTDIANEQMDKNLMANAKRLKADPNPSALSHMVNAKNPIPWSQMVSNVKIAIGGGINEPRDALLTTLFGLLTNPDQLEAVQQSEAWEAAFEESVRWVAPIQVSSRLVTTDTELRGYKIHKGETVMTIQASANRDEDFIDNGENFDALRAKNKHQGFGTGPHHCMGARVSRLTVGRILLPRFFERFPNASLQNPDTVPWVGFGFRGPGALHVKLA